jgi:hypothetical protein
VYRFTYITSIAVVAGQQLWIEFETNNGLQNTFSADMGTGMPTPALEETLDCVEEPG